ncbi:MAG: CinA family nicotinamide mononucleotide deamidase-related protein [Planctomycetes bacterium]|nr:CinA family nicotinamide mononucleotide deamidase-related protein [Planctomycetota bacterium]
MTMHFSILAIGDELMLGQKVDTNTAWISGQLLERSLLPVEHRTVGDDRAQLAAAIAALAATSDVLVITGGLGPTEDDLTRFALGDALTPGRELVADEAAGRTIERWFRRRGRALQERNAVQAQRPTTMRMLENPNGTAPGLAGTHGRCAIYALPGPPAEMKAMMRDHVLPDLPVTDGMRVVTGIVNAYGIGESDAAERLGPILARDRQPRVGITASAGVISARVLSRAAAGEAETQRADTNQRIERAWSPYVFGRDETTLAAAVGGQLREAGQTLVTAESCTGGWLGKMIVDEPGASDWYLGGWVSYANDMKSRWLGVGAELLEVAGAVSEPVAAAMAVGALEHGPADHALSITGVAGPTRPDEPEPEKPPGLVFIGLASRGDDDGPEVLVRRFRYRGDRAAVRLRSARTALQLLRFRLADVREDTPLLWQYPRPGSGGDP